MKKSNAKLFTLLSKTTISSKQVVKVKRSDTERQECNIAKCLERSCLPHWSILILSHNLKGKSTRSKWLHTQGWFLWPAFETTSINSAKSDRSVRQHHVDTNNRQYCARFTFLTLPLKCMVYDEAVNVTDVTVNSFSSDDLLMKSYEAFFFTIFILISQNKTRKKKNWRNHTVPYSSHDTVFKDQNKAAHVSAHAHLPFMLCKNNKLEPASQFSGAVCYI